MDKRKLAAVLLLALTLISTLICTNIFGEASMSAYFFFVIAAAAFSFVSAFQIFGYKYPINISRPSPVIFFSLFSIYVACNQIFAFGAISYDAVYIITCAILLCTSSFLFSGNVSVQYAVLKIILFVAAAESILCILQVFGIVPSQNIFFNVTGSYINPNVTAMFLTMAVPACLAILYIRERRYRQFAVLALILIVVALILLKCRTAYVGVVVAALFLLNARYDLIRRVKEKYKKTTLYLFFVGGIVIVVALAIVAYNLKAESAEGRKLVWKISTSMIAKKPFTGHGYQMFEHDYNLAQAQYFADGNGTTREKENAGYIYSAYDEFIQNAVEGGLIGLILFISVLASLIFPARFDFTDKKARAGADKKRYWVYESAYTGILVFAALSIFNFTEQAIPVMCVFVLYAGIVCAGDPAITVSHKYSPIYKYSILPAIILFAIYIGFSQVALAQDYLRCKHAAFLVHQHKGAEAIRVLNPLEKSLGQSPGYWIVKGNAWAAQKQYPEALTSYTNAAKYASSSNIYMQMGFCYQQLSDVDGAKYAYSVAMNNSPNRLRPRFELMKLYFSSKDTVNALDMAHSIATIKPKVPNEQVAMFKHAAVIFLRKFEAKDPPIQGTNTK